MKLADKVIGLVRKLGEESFDKNKWINFAKETIKNDEPQLLDKLNFNSFGDAMEKVNNGAGSIESNLWSGANPSGTEDRTWVRVWAYLNGGKKEYKDQLSGFDGAHSNRILGAFRTVGMKGESNESFGHIEFDGHNFNEIKNLLAGTGVRATQKSDGQVILSFNNKDYTVFKEDVVDVKDNKVSIVKPSYVGTGTFIVKESFSEEFKMSPERATKILANTRLGGDLKYAFPRDYESGGGSIFPDGITKEEDEYIKALWKTMPGNTSYSSALIRISKGMVESNSMELKTHRDGIDKALKSIENLHKQTADLRTKKAAEKDLSKRKSISDQIFKLNNTIYDYEQDIADRRKKMKAIRGDHN